jgi:ATP-dependent DNA helicase RecQ
LGETRERISKALSWLEETGAITLKPAGLRHGFRLCGDAAERDPSAVAQRLAALFVRREERESLRLRQILDFATLPGCITRRLLAHFGEEMDEENCGHCHPCRTGVGDVATAKAKWLELPAKPIRSFTERDAEAVRGLMAERHPALSTARQLTRYLCGLTSPATARAKLSKRREFGMFAAIPFRTVMSWVEEITKD